MEFQDSSIYEEYDSLNNAITGGDQSPVALIHLDYLFELHGRNQIIPCRQELPAHAVFSGTIDDEVLLLVLSYSWCARQHPDPEGRVLADVCQFGRYLEELRSFVGPTHLGLRGRKVVVFWDFTSLYQRRKDYPWTKLHARSFKEGLSFVNVLYAHTKTWVLLCTRAYRALRYLDSAWPFFEWSVSHLIKHPELIVDLPTALCFIEQTATDSESWNRSLYFLREACRQRTWQIALTPDAFSANLKHKAVTKCGDRELLRIMYRQAFVTVVRPASSFKLCDVPGIGAARWWSFLSETLRQCRLLRELDLSCNEAISCSLAPFSALGALEILRVSLCPCLWGTLAPLEGLVRLRELDVAGCLGLEGGLEPLARLTDLCRLDLQACAGLRGSFEPLEGLHALQRLDVRGTALVGWAALAQRAPSVTSGRGPEQEPAPWLLCRAAYYGMANTVKLLVQCHAAADQKRDDGYTPLILAAEKGYAPIVRLLLQHGAAVDLAENTGATPLFMAAQNGHLDVGELLFQHNATLDLADDNGATALFMATQQGHGKMVELLLRAKASVDLAENTGRTPLFMAAAKGHVHTARPLLSHGAGTNVCRDNGATPLLVTALQGHAEMVGLLLRSSAAPDEADVDGYTPLSGAADNGQTEVVRLLLDHGATVDQADTIGCTPLFWAASNGHGDVVHSLIKGGAAVDREGDDGFTPLFMAAMNGHGTATRHLLEQHAHANQVYGDGTTPLHMAARGGHCEVLRALLEHRAAVDQADDTGTAALHIAVAEGQGEAAGLLLERGALANLADAEGTVPLHLSTQSGHGETTQLLLAHGAATDQADRSGYTPLYMAVQNGHRALVETLLASGVSREGLADWMLEEELEDASEEEERAAAQGQDASGGPVLLHLGGRCPDLRHDRAARILCFGRSLGMVGVFEAVATSGILYYEVQLAETLGVPLLGFVTLAFKADPSSTDGLGSDGESWAVDGLRWILLHSGNSHPWSCSCPSDSVIGLAANLDKGKIAICRGGWSNPSSCVAFENQRIKAGVFPCISASLCRLRYNFDGRVHGAFVHEPPPATVWGTPPMVWDLARAEI